MAGIGEAEPTEVEELSSLQESEAQLELQTPLSPRAYEAARTYGGELVLNPNLVSDNGQPPGPPSSVTVLSTGPTFGGCGEWTSQRSCPTSYPASRAASINGFGSSQFTQDGHPREQEQEDASTTPPHYALTDYFSMDWASAAKLDQDLGSPAALSCKRERMVNFLQDGSCHRSSQLNLLREEHTTMTMDIDGPGAAKMGLHCGSLPNNQELHDRARWPTSPHSTLQATYAFFGSLRDYPSPGVTTPDSLGGAREALEVEGPPLIRRKDGLGGSDPQLDLLAKAFYTPEVLEPPPSTLTGSCWGDPSGLDAPQSKSLGEVGNWQSFEHEQGLSGAQGLTLDLWPPNLPPVQTGRKAANHMRRVVSAETLREKPKGRCPLLRKSTSMQMKEAVEKGGVKSAEHMEQKRQQAGLSAMKSALRKQQAIASRGMYAFSSPAVSTQQGGGLSLGLPSPAPLATASGQSSPPEEARKDGVSKSSKEEPASGSSSKPESEGSAKPSRAKRGIPERPGKTPHTFGQRSSCYRGVTKHRWTGRYEAHLWDNSCRKQGGNKKGRQVYLGGYDKEEAAARAYDLAALKYWGVGTLLNFPLSDYEDALQEMEGVSRQEYVAMLRRKSSGFSRGASKYRGVTRHHQHGRWEARIGRVMGNKYLYLGTYSTQEEAAEAYDIAAVKYRGTQAVTNFDLSRYAKLFSSQGVDSAASPTLRNPPAQQGTKAQTTMAPGVQHVPMTGGMYPGGLYQPMLAPGTGVVYQEPSVGQAAGDRMYPPQLVASNMYGYQPMCPPAMYGPGGLPIDVHTMSHVPTQAMPMYMSYGEQMA